MNLDLLEYQYEFIASNSKKALMLGGIGSGKSVAGSHFSIRMLSEFPKSKGLITANTYTQLANATVTAFCAELEKCNIPYELTLSGSRKRIELLNTIIYLYSLEKPNNIRGIEAGWWWSDESCFSREDAVKVAKGRLRDKNGPLFERHTSSPNGYNYFYDTYENKDGSNKTDKTHLIRAVTKDNIFLPEEYYADLIEEYGGEDNPLAKQELFGQFVNLQAGAIYWGFDRNFHVQKTILKKEYPVYIAQDFNIGNMANVYVQIIAGHTYVTQENILSFDGANTDNAAQRICKDLVNYQKFVVADSTGKAEKTSASGRTDIEILRSYGLEVVHSKNPFIRDRQNALNILFKKNKIIIDPSCKTLIKELETLSSRDKEGEKAHVSVALGYLVWKYFPIKRGLKTTSIQL